MRPGRTHPRARPAGARGFSGGLAGALLLLLGAAACAPGDGRVERRLYAMGTWVDIELEAADRRAARDALAAVESMLRGFERDYHAWNDGELKRLNTAIRAHASLRVSPGLERMLVAAQRLAAASGGTFEPGIGALVELWGFHDPAGRTNPPPAALIEDWLALGDSIADLTIEDGIVGSDSATLNIDLGGIAKGEAVDRAIEILRDHSIERALVNAGGDVRVLGRRSERAWRVGVRAPRADALLGTLDLDPGEAVFTSGDYERYFVHAGRRLHHILDPDTGYPVTHTQAVTVLAEDGVTADAAATALLVAGPDDWLDVATALGVDAALRVDASGRIHATPRMRDRLQPAGARPLDIMAPTD